MSTYPQYEKPMVGPIRIKNAKTLEKWIHKGWYQRELDYGYIFALGCGRFRPDVCTCQKCRRTIHSPLSEVIKKHYKKL
jgi:hypothetical protein